MESSQSALMLVFQLLGSLALLMFGMKMMSETLQKMAGPQLRHVLGRMTTNRFTGMFTGMFVTAAVHLGSGNQCDNGCEHRHNADSLDYVSCFRIQHYKPGMASFYLSHLPHIQKEKQKHR